MVNCQGNTKKNKSLGFIMSHFWCIFVLINSTTMSTAEIKLTIFELLATTKDTKVLNSIYKQLKSQTEKKEADFWDEFSPEQKEEIMASIEESDKGETTPHSQVMKKYKKWL